MNYNKLNVKLKVLISILLVFIIIGLANIVGSYAWFIDTAEVKNDLVVTMGTLNTEISDGIDKSIKPGESTEAQIFTITNTGTLKQNTKIKLTQINGNDTDLSNLIYKLIVYDKNEDKRLLVEDSLYNLKYTESEMIDIGQINPANENSITCEETVTSTSYDTFSESEVDFKLQVQSNQINNKNFDYKWFSDIAIQDNTIKLEQEIIEGSLEIRFGDDFNPNITNKIYINIEPLITTDLTGINQYRIFKLIEGTGYFSQVEIEVNSISKNRIIIKKKISSFNLSNADFTSNQQLILEQYTRDIKGNEIYVGRYILQFRINDNGQLECKYKKIT